MKTTYNTLYNVEPSVIVIHAGLECGIIGRNYPGMEMVSFGPTIEHPHSPDERVNIASVAKFYEFLLATLKAL
jgi:dipeptidase D